MSGTGSRPLALEREARPLDAELGEAQLRAPVENGSDGGRGVEPWQVGLQRVGEPRRLKRRVTHRRAQLAPQLDQTAPRLQSIEVHHLGLVLDREPIGQVGESGVVELIGDLDRLARERREALLELDAPLRRGGAVVEDAQAVELADADQVAHRARPLHLALEDRPVLAQLAAGHDGLLEKASLLAAVATRRERILFRGVADHWIGIETHLPA